MTIPIDNLTITRNQDPANPVVFEIAGTDRADLVRIDVEDDGIYLCPQQGCDTFERAPEECRLLVSRPDMEAMMAAGKRHITVSLGAGADTLYYADYSLPVKEGMNLINRDWRMDALHDGWSWAAGVRIVFDGGDGEDQSFLRTGWWQKVEGEEANGVVESLSTKNGDFEYIVPDTSKNVERWTPAGNPGDQISGSGRDCFMYDDEGIKGDHVVCTGYEWWNPTTWNLFR